MGLKTEKPQPSLKPTDESSKKRLFSNLLMGTLKVAKKEVAADSEKVRRRRTAANRNRTIIDTRSIDNDTPMLTFRSLSPSFFLSFFLSVKLRANDAQPAEKKKRETIEKIEKNIKEEQVCEVQ
jgi:hypothetical protein